MRLSHSDERWPKLNFGAENGRAALPTTAPHGGPSPMPVPHDARQVHGKAEKVREGLVATVLGGDEGGRAHEPRARATSGSTEARTCTVSGGNSPRRARQSTREIQPRRLPLVARHVQHSLNYSRKNELTVSLRAHAALKAVPAPFHEHTRTFATSEESRQISEW